MFDHFYAAIVGSSCFIITEQGFYNFITTVFTSSVLSSFSLSLSLGFLLMRGSRSLHEGINTVGLFGSVRV